MSLVAGVTVSTTLWGRTTAEHSNAFDVGWKTAAAVLAVLAAFVGVDRLRLAQREHSRQLIADQASRAEATARQITELSAKASEQLGSDKAAVRIGGLTDLERLAQAYPELRQTVAERICAYLRAPYHPPPDHTDNDSILQRRPNRLMSPNHRNKIPSDTELAERRLELDVRRTAQQILKRHLSWPADANDQPPGFWGSIELDLRDAALVELDLQNCRIASADFRNTMFYRTTVFNRATFSGDAVFQGAKFFGRLWFTDALFTDEALFHGASFGEDAAFQRTKFSMSAFFNRASFTKGADFGRTVIGDALFYRTRFDGDARFGATTFRGNATFEESRFSANADFRDARVNNPDGGQKWPSGWRSEPDPNAPRGGHRLRYD